MNTQCCQNDDLINEMRSLKYRQTPDVLLVLPKQMNELRERVSQQNSILGITSEPTKYPSFPASNLFFLGVKIQECQDRHELAVTAVQLTAKGKRVAIIDP